MPTDSSTQSYQLTSSSITVKGDSPSTYGGTASCAEGYYVRPAPPGVWTPADGAQPAFHLAVSNDSKWVSMSSTKKADIYPSGVFRTFQIWFHSLTPYTHTVTFTWTCDALTNWSTSRATSASDGNVGITPWGPSCYYCQIDSVRLTNEGNGYVLDNSGGTQVDGNPIITWPLSGGDNQLWYFDAAGFADQLPTFSIWQQARLLKWLIVPSAGGPVVLRSSNGSVPDGGSWSYVDMTGQGPNPGDVMLVNYPYGTCLSAPADAGQPVIGVTCDTHDEAQWWNPTQSSLTAPSAVRANLDVKLRVPPTTTAGGRVRATILVTNRGPSAASKIRVVTHASRRLKLVHSSGATTGNGSAVIRTHSLPPGATAAHRVLYKVRGSAPGTTRIRATVSSGSQDRHQHNNAVTRAVRIR